MFKLNKNLSKDLVILKFYIYNGDSNKFKEYEAISSEAFRNRRSDFEENRKKPAGCFQMIYTNSDGGARGNPGPGAIGIIIREDENILIRFSQTIGKFVTNNIAEYEGLIKALELASEITNKELTCCLDSELIVKQLLGEYKVRNPKLFELFLKVQKIQEKFEKIIYKHVSRYDTYQVIADELLNQELDKEFGVRKYYRK